MAEGLSPRGDVLRAAARRIAARREEEPQAPVVQLIAEAARHFDLSPGEELLLQEEFLPSGAGADASQP